MARPEVLVFDVNETLSDMSPLAGRFTDVGAPGHLAPTWFAGLLRDGFALTVAGTSAPFADIGSTNLRGMLAGQPLTTGLDDAVAHVMEGFTALAVHPDVPDGLRALRGLGIRLVTLSNGSSSVARKLLGDAGLTDELEALLSVEDAGVWKPAPAAYRHALDATGVDASAAMLVAVHPWDTDGARRAGLRSAWVDRSAQDGEGASYPGHFLPPDVRASSLPHLAELLS